MFRPNWLLVLALTAVANLNVDSPLGQVPLYRVLILTTSKSRQNLVLILRRVTLVHNAILETALVRWHRTQVFAMARCQKHFAGSLRRLLMGRGRHIDPQPRATADRCHHDSRRHRGLLYQGAARHLKN